MPLLLPASPRELIVTFLGILDVHPVWKTAHGAALHIREASLYLGAKILIQRTIKLLSENFSLSVGWFICLQYETKFIDCAGT